MKFIDCDSCCGGYPIAAEPKGEWLVRTDTNDRTPVWLCYWCARLEAIKRDAEAKLALEETVQTPAF